MKQVAFGSGVSRYYSGAICVQEAPLQRNHDKWNRTGGRGSNDTTLLALNGVIVLTLICLALRAPLASEWISAAAQAEFVGIDIPAPSAQIARPVEAMRTARTD